MSGSRLAVVVTAALAGGGAAVALSACGGDDSQPSAEQVASIKREVLREERAKQRAEKAERELKQLRREVEKLKKRRVPRAAPQVDGGSSSSGGSSSGSSACGNGISVNSVTTCPFAVNVAAAFYADGPGTVYASSPVTGQTYAMQCSGGVPTVCTGGNGAAVYIR